MAPTNTLKFIVNELIDKQTLAVMKLRRHRCAFDDHRLHKDAEQYKDDDYQNISNSFSPRTRDLTRFASKTSPDVGIVASETNEI